MKTVSFTQLGTDVLLELRTARFYILTRQRNAWHSTTSVIYRGPTSLAVTVAQARASAGPWRKQGSHFTVQQVPGLLLLGDQHRVAVTEFHTNDSFAGWSDANLSQLTVGTALRDAVAALGSAAAWEAPAPSEHSWVMGLLDPMDEPEPLPRSAFLSWDSVARGADNPLWWQEHPGRHHSRGAKRVLRAYRTINAEP